MKATWQAWFVFLNIFLWIFSQSLAVCHLFLDDSINIDCNGRKCNKEQMPLRLRYWTSLPSITWKIAVTEWIPQHHLDSWYFERCCYPAGSLAPLALHVCSCMLGCVWLFAIPCTIARQAPLSMGLSQQGSWSGFPFPLPGDLPDSGIKYVSCFSFIAGRFFTTEPLGKPTASQTLR